nr:MAG TPA: integrase [Caudoviricetes sp.]
MPKKVAKVAQIPKLQRKKQVAAYARVSSGKDAMLHSLSAQVSYYNDLIQKEDGWEFVGVYADEAITGTKEGRTDFQRRLTDCRNGKIDMIITKSISRFARNTVTLLETVRMLKALEVDVFFEEQNIHTMSADGELMLTILASYAQEESRSASENQKWRIKKNFEEGMPWCGRMLGYRIRAGQYYIIPDEAEIVRRIYREYLDGAGPNGIANRLTEDGVPTRNGGIWQPQTIAKILRNYTYTGNLLLQKTFRENHITKKTIRNTGQKTQYLLENAHEAIIPLKTFNAVQTEIERRSESRKSSPPAKPNFTYTGLIQCAKCGKNYRRKTTATRIVWICATFNTRGKKYCASKQIPEELLDALVAEVFDTPANIQKIIADDGNTLHFHLVDGSVVTRIWSDRSRAESWTPEKRESARKRAKERSQTQCQKQ